MNVGQIKASIYPFGFSAADPVLDWINEANAQFVEAFDWPWLKQATSGVTSIGSPVLPVAALTQAEVPDAVFIILLNPTRVIPLDYRSYHKYLDDLQISADVGIPRYFTMIGTSYYLYPTPDAAYTCPVYYTAVAETFTADGNTPLIPSRYHYALVRGAAAIGLDTENQEDRATTQQERFQEIIDRAMSKYRSEQQGKFGKIRNVRD